MMFRPRAMVFEHRNEIDGRARRTLVKPLEKGMLSIRAFIAPNNRTCQPSLFAVTRDTLAVALHFKLLQKGSEFSDAAGIRNNRLRAIAQYIAVPYSRQRHHDRQVFLKRLIAKMHIHFGGTFQKVIEDIWAECDLQAKPDRAPDGITSANPIPKIKNLITWDVKGESAVTISRNSNEIITRFFTQRLGQPCPRRFGVHACFLCRERFRDHNNQSRFRVKAVQGIINRSPVNILSKP